MDRYEVYIIFTGLFKEMAAKFAMAADLCQFVLRTWNRRICSRRNDCRTLRNFEPTDSVPIVLGIPV